LFEIMKFKSVSNKGGTCYEYRVAFSSEEVEERLEKAIEQRAKTFKLQGFRIGHAPISVVRNNVEVYETREVLKSLSREACARIREEHRSAKTSFNPLVEAVSPYEKGKDFEIIVEIEFIPDFDLKPFELKFKKHVVALSDEQKNKLINDEMKKKPYTEEAPKGYEIKSGDVVICKIFMDEEEQPRPHRKSKKKKRGDEPKRYSLFDFRVPELTDSDGFKKELVRMFVGKKAGDRVELVFDPALVAAAEHESTSEHAALSVAAAEHEPTSKHDALSAAAAEHEPTSEHDALSAAAAEHEPFTKSRPITCFIKEILIPQLDLTFEEYAEKVNIPAEEILENIIAESTESVESEFFLMNKHKMLEYLMSQYDFELPLSVVRREIANVLDTIKRDVKETEEKGMPHEDSNKSDDQLLREYAVPATERVKLGYVISKIAAKNKIDAEAHEIIEKIMHDKVRPLEELLSVEELDVFVETIFRDEDFIDYKRAEIIEDKVIRYLIELATEEKEEIGLDKADELIEQFWKKSEATDDDYHLDTPIEHMNAARVAVIKIAREAVYGPAEHGNHEMLLDETPPDETLPDETLPDETLQSETAHGIDDVSVDATEALTDTAMTASNTAEALTDTAMTASNTAEVLTDTAMTANDTAEALTDTTSTANDTAEVLTDTASTASNTAEVLTDTATTANDTAEALTDTAMTASNTAEVLTDTAATANDTAEALTDTASTANDTAEVLTDTAMTASNTAEVLTDTATTASNTAEVLTDTATTASNTAEVLTDTAAAESDATEASTNTTAVVDDTVVPAATGNEESSQLAQSE
jgi:FKBP-type peptidyl-prolyl cis-trans isomerase (trigger factor)